MWKEKWKMFAWKKKKDVCRPIARPTLNVGNVGSDAKFELAKDGSKRKNQCFKAAVASVVPDDD